MEQTLVLIKPDAVQRGLIGEIILRLERRGLKLVGSKFVQISKEFAETHYAVHKGKTFFDGLIVYITSAPVMAMVWEGPNAVEAVRQTTGSTHPLHSPPGSIRHDFALEVGRNLIHASDSKENALQEISLWFTQSEIISWERSNDPWIYELNP